MPTKVIVGQEQKKGLRTKKVRPIYNWYSWLELWNATDNLQMLAGLLHTGYTVSMQWKDHAEPRYDNINRDEFYFEIADGWDEAELLVVQPDDSKNQYFFSTDEHNGDEHKTMAELRQVLAKKAFHMLCLNFFKQELLVEGRRGQEFSYVWEEIITGEKFFPVIQNFFRVERDDIKGITVRNLPPHRTEKTCIEDSALKFLLNLATFVWEWKGDDTNYWSEDKQKQQRERNKATQARLDAAKPWLIEILYKMGQLDMLRKWILKLDEPTLNKLKEIAFRHTHFSKYQNPVTKDRPPANVDEAIYLGSKAAGIIKYHEIMTRVHQQLVKVCDAEIALAHALKAQTSNGP